MRSVPWPLFVVFLCGVLGSVVETPQQPSLVRIINRELLFVFDCIEEALQSKLWVWMGIFVLAATFTINFAQRFILAQPGDRTTRRPAAVEPVQSYDDPFERGDSACLICSDQPARVCFYPCGHQLSCRNCAPRLARCCMCQTEVKNRLRVYNCGAPRDDS